MKSKVHTHYLETFCLRRNIRLELFNSVPEAPKVQSHVRTPFTSPPFTGSLSGTPHVFSPDVGMHPLVRPEVVPPLSLDGSALGKVSHSPPGSPTLGPHQLSAPVMALQEKLQASPQIGLVHLALHSDAEGLVLRFAMSACIVLGSAGLSLSLLTQPNCHHQLENGHYCCC